MKMARQGDVLVRRIEGRPAKATKRKREEGLVILARGEATGHHHSFGSRLVSMYAVADEFERMGGGYIEIKGTNGAALRHQEHAPIKFPPGDYQVVRQREWMDAPIMVAD